MGDVWAALKSMSPNGCTTSTNSQGLYIRFSNPDGKRSKVGIWRAFCAGATNENGRHRPYPIARNLVLAALSPKFIRPENCSASQPARGCCDDVKTISGPMQIGA